MTLHIARNAIAGMLRPEKVAKPALDSTDVKNGVDDKTIVDPLLDAVNEKKPDEAKPDENKGDESVMDAASEYAASDVAVKAVAAIQEWAETVSSDLEEGEGLGDRLFSLLVGIADEDMDGEISEDEAEVVNMAAEAAAEYLISKGVSEEDAISLLEDFDNDLAATVQEFLVEKLGEGDDSDDFVFGDGSDESALDAVYKKKLVVRKGKKVRINKRVSGRVRLSAKQKMGIRKMLRKSHSAVAMMRRAKSNRVRKSAGL